MTDHNIVTCSNCKLVFDKSTLIHIPYQKDGIAIDECLIIKKKSKLYYDILKKNKTIPSIIVVNSD